MPLTDEPSRDTTTVPAAKNTLAYGVFRHGVLWLTSGIQQTIYYNPNSQRSSKQNEDISIYCIHGTGDRPGALSDLAERLVQGELPSKCRLGRSAQHILILI